jgi:Permuted papain-like amidase enzyme, YaeF/YiiX, C92 family
MQDMSAQPSRRFRRWLGRCLLALAGLYLLLLIPETKPPQPKGAGQQPFAWNRDAFWSELETKFREARTLDNAERLARFNQSLEQVQRALDAVAETNLPPTAPEFDELESRFFQLAPIAAACPERLADFVSAAAQMRHLVKWQSERWPMDSAETRHRIYRLLYGRRAAVEEAMLQSPGATNALELNPSQDDSATPSAEVRGVKIHSGDIFLSRGGAATSALIARGNDFPGNFSHVALVHVDERTKKISVIESHIESGVGVSSIEKYLGDTKLRIMVLRLRADLPQLVADPKLPHRAASLAVSNALAHHIPYDFAMDYRDASSQFCSEVASSAYQSVGVNLWMGLSHLSTRGVTSWLAALGVRHFETQEPSDLEYDPQLRVVAEWRDPQTLFKDRADNAVIDVMLEAANRGEPLGYNPWLLPPMRLAKAWCVALNGSGKVGPIPEGMSATTALRVQRLKASHAALKARLLEKAEKFKAEKGYVPPYWELVRMAREAQTE